MIPLIRFRATLDLYPDTGRSGVALALGKSDDVLRKEASGASAGHKLGFTDALRALETLQNAGVNIEPVLSAIVEHFGARLADAGEAASSAPNLNLLSANASQQVTEAAFEVVRANADSKISDNEHKSIQSRIIDAKDALDELARGADAVYAQGKAGKP